MRNKTTYDFIKTFIAEKGYSPTLREIGKGTGYAHTAALDHVLDLELNGYILRDAGVGRSIRLTQVGKL